MAEALYRKYRPQVFGDVIGQEHIERTLKNAIEGNRVSHAYLFTGPRGTGKTTTARLLAKALICENGPTSNPCSTCEDCQLIASGAHPDVYELDAASRTGVDSVREEIIGRVQYAPTRGRSKVYIVDEVHMLSTAAFNALLKTLEEPPSHVVFILCTTDPQKVPETIRSRCQRFDFRRISPENIVSRLGAICVAEGVQFEGEALDLIAQRCDGGMRDALTSLEQLITYGAGNVTMEEAERLLGSLDVDEMAEIVEAIGRRDAAACFRWTARYVETGADLAQFTQDLIERIRNLYVFSILGSDACVAVGEVERRQIAQELPLFGPDRLAYILGVLGDVQKELRTSANMRLTFEIALTRMAHPATDLTLEALAARIEALEAAKTTQTAHEKNVPPREVPSRQSIDGVNASEGTSQRQAASAGTGMSARRQAGSAGTGTHGSPSVDLSNNAALQRAWQHVMAIVKKEKTAYGVLFLNTKARNDGGRLLIEFSAESGFAFKAVQKPEIDDVLSRAIRQVFNADVPYAFAQAASPAAGATVHAASQAAGFAHPDACADEPIHTAAQVSDVSSISTMEHVSACVEAAPEMTGQAPAIEVPAIEVPEYEAPPYDDWMPEAEEEPPFDSWIPETETGEGAAASQQRDESAVGLDAAESTPSQASAEGMQELQDALSLFGAVKIEEID